MKVHLEHTTDERYPHEFSREFDWPAAPQLGDFIELRDDKGEPVRGSVRDVMWDERGEPLVRFR